VPPTPPSSALRGLLEDAQRLGFLGPGAVEDHITHALGFATAAVGPSGVRRALDLGAGGGVPGLVLAELWPDVAWVLLDANERRTAFLEEAVHTLDRPKSLVVRDRAETAARDPQLRGTFDLVVARSFAAPAVTAECAAGFLSVGGRLVVSEPPEADDARWPPAAVSALGFADVQYLPGPPRFAVLELAVLSSDRVPRRVGIPAKRPLW
jgi:16S rRNA (guanine527-N7)-methyltransferase